jgi:4-amino-4-deoxy-L-arabinose transferase-like glycosyltransferase
MTIAMFDKFLLGGIVACCLFIGLFFLRFHRRTHDRLFLFFAAAFWLLGINWLMLVFYDGEEKHPHLYLIRLVAFVVLLIGIADKNRART